MSTQHEAAEGIARIEGFLLWNAETVEARRQAALFTAQMPWLTRAQREEVGRIYVADRLAVSKGVLHRVADRAAELRGEYTQRYGELRRRCVARAVTVAATATTAATAAGVTLFR